LTPPSIILALGPFDLDPCCPPYMPWRTADLMLTEAEDGLFTPWDPAARVWLNPPYGTGVIEPWLEKMALHPGAGITLVFARTETAAFHRFVWPYACGLLFVEGRLYFHHADGTRASANSGAPSVLIAYSKGDAERLQASGIAGAYVELRARV
jgi:hypothetical protein